MGQEKKINYVMKEEFSYGKSYGVPAHLLPIHSDGVWVKKFYLSVNK